jgi:uncharacterized membrane protein
MSSPTKPRLHFLDWVRGAAAIIMLQGHVFDSFAAGAQRQDPVFVLSQFVGGMPPAIFLFLTGITLAFLLESQERKELPWFQKLTGVFYRARYLLLVAILFRLQLFFFAWPTGSWNDVLKVDILNCMGVSILLMAPVALLGRMQRIRASLLTGIVIAAAAPLIANADWSGTPELLKHYLVPSTQFFAIFPWAAFLAFGVATGTMLKIASARDLGRFAQWAAIAGFVLAVGAQQLSNIPYSIYSKSDFWVDSPWLIFIKLGITLVILGIAYLWTSHVSTGWSLVRQLGTTSLLVYWVHTEIVYGRWFWDIKGSLTIPQIAFSAAAVIVAMLGLSLVQTNWPRIRAALAARQFSFSLEPTRAEGD